MLLALQYACIWLWMSLGALLTWSMMAFLLQKFLAAVLNWKNKECVLLYDFIKNKVYELRVIVNKSNVIREAVIADG